MRKVICSIRDSKAEAFLPPMFFMAKGQAVRVFRDACNNRDMDIGKHPEDYTLFVVGEFDEQSGKVFPMVHESLGNGVIFVEGVPVNEDA